MNSPTSAFFDLSVSGMTCSNCAGHVEHALRQVKGVAAIHVDFAAGKVSLQAPANSLPALQEAVSAAGYTVSSQRIELDIQGMHCGSCVRHVEHALLEVSSVKSVVVDLDSGRASIDSVGASHPEHLIAAVEAAGYAATVVQAALSESTTHG
jgi:P-type Cu+ transporter